MSTLSVTDIPDVGHGKRNDLCQSKVRGLPEQEPILPIRVIVRLCHEVYEVLALHSKSGYKICVFFIVLSFYFSGERALKEISYFIINAVCAFLNK